MAEDLFKPTGATKASTINAGGAVTKNVPVIGIVKNNIDPIRSGRIQVYIADFGSSAPDDSSSWVTVSFMSPFYGVTRATGSNTGYGDFLSNPTSYGTWYSPPDLGTTVVCIFINGDINYGFYIGSIPQPEALFMVPAIGGSSEIIANAGESKSYGGALRLPVTNMNTDSAKADSNGFLDEPKPVHSYVASILTQQGLIRDSVRGVIGTSSQRESPSRVGWGVSTPGRPIYEGGYNDETLIDNLQKDADQLKMIGRRGGHTLVMDDGDILGRDQLVRLRSSLGHQILMSDDAQCLFIIHSNGQSWIELGKEGTVDIFSTNSFNIRTQGDINFHADNNININAAKNLNISAENINVASTKETTQRVGTNFSFQGLGKYTVKISNAMSMAAGGEASYASSATTYINGSKVNLNTGSTSVIPSEVKPMTMVSHTDTLSDPEKGFAAAPGKLESIVTRAPAHMPWVNAGQGVDVKTSGAASAVLPSSPTPALVSVNAATAGEVVIPVTPAVMATIPAVGAVSKSIDTNAAAGLIAQASTMAAAGSDAMKNAIAVGAGIVTNVAGSASAVVGKFAQTPLQLEASKVLKAGSAALVGALAQKAGATATSILPSNLFAGAPGAETLTALIKNPAAQASSMITTMQQSQSSLMAAGAITGKEAPTQLAGLVLGGVTSGVKSVTDFVKTATGAAGAAVSGVTNSVLGSVKGAIASGNAAANIAATVTGGLGSLAGALGKGVGGAMDAAKGVVGSAFSAITDSFKPLVPNVPQNLKSIAAGTATASDAINNPSAVIGTAVSGGGAAVAAGVAGAGAAVSSGLNAIPGGAAAVSSVVNKAAGAVNAIPGTSAISALIKSGGNLSSINPTGLGLAALAATGLSKGASAILNSAVSSLTSGGASAIKLATVALNTYDRGEIKTQLTSVLGSPKIPMPVFGQGNPATLGDTAGTAKIDKRSEILDEYLTAAGAYRNALIKAIEKRKPYDIARNEFPAGDPRIATAKQEYDAAYDNMIALREKKTEAEAKYDASA